MGTSGARSHARYVGRASPRRRSAPALRLALALVATGALAVPSDAAAAPTPHWYADGTLVVGTVKFKSLHESNSLFIHLPTVTLECTMHFSSGSVINPSGGEAGIDAMSVKSAKRGISKPLAYCEPEKNEGPEGCEPVYRVYGKTLPVRSHLAIEPSLPGVRDVIEGTPLDIYCESTPERFFEVASLIGALKPKVGTSRLEFEAEPTSAELDKEDAQVWGTEAGPNEVVTATLTGGFSLKGVGHNKKVLTAQ
jgi:hypothetical protein